MKYILPLIMFILVFVKAPFSKTNEGIVSEDCKVLMEDISESYKGNCKDGLAHGKGVAKGKDTYKGKFIEGFPEGKGKYTYENGNVFTGNFKRGLKHGSGKFTYKVGSKTYTQKGYWVEGDYVGLDDPSVSYKIILQNGVDKIAVNKLGNTINKLKVSFYALNAKYVPKGLKINSSSGQITQTGLDFYIINLSTGSSFIDIEYVISKGGQSKICQASIEILDIGEYNIDITNE